MFWLVFMSLHFNDTVLSHNFLFYDCVCMLSISLCCLGVNSMLAGTKYWVPKIRLLFSAENPHVFVERIKFALHLREKTEALILYNLTVDALPIWSGMPSLDTQSLQRIKARVGPRLKLKT